MAPATSTEAAKLAESVQVSTAASSKQNNSYGTVLIHNEEGREAPEEDRQRLEAVYRTGMMFKAVAVVGLALVVALHVATKNGSEELNKLLGITRGRTPDSVYVNDITELAMARATMCANIGEQCTSGSDVCKGLQCVPFNPPYNNGGIAAERNSCTCMSDQAKNFVDYLYLMYAADVGTRQLTLEGNEFEATPMWRLLSTVPYNEKIPDDHVIFDTDLRTCMPIDKNSCKFLNDFASRQTYGGATQLFYEIEPPPGTGLPLESDRRLMLQRTLQQQQSPDTSSCPVPAANATSTNETCTPGIFNDDTWFDAVKTDIATYNKWAKNVCKDSDKTVCAPTTKKIAIKIAKNIAANVLEDSILDLLDPFFIIFQIAAVLVKGMTALINLCSDCPSWLLDWLKEMKFMDKILADIGKMVKKIAWDVLWKWTFWHWLWKNHKDKKEMENSGGVYLYTGNCWITLHGKGWDSGGESMAAYWQTNQGSPLVVYGLGDGSIQYWNSTNWIQLHDSGWGSSAITLEAQFSTTPSFNSQHIHVVVGLCDGSVQYLDSAAGSWTQLHDNGWGAPAVALSVQWASESDDNQVRVVVGLGDSSVQYWNGFGGWDELHDTGWSNNIGSMSVGWNGDEKPQVVVGLGNGSIQYFDGNSWTQLQGERCKSCNCPTGFGSKNPSCSGYNINFMEVQFFSGDLRVVYGNNYGDVWYFNQGSWQNLLTSPSQEEKYGTYGLCVQWPASGTSNAPEVVLGLRNGTVSHYDGAGWKKIISGGYSQLSALNCTFDASSSPDTPPMRFVATYNNGTVAYYPLSVNCSQVEMIQSTTSKQQQLHVLSVDYIPYGSYPPRIVAGLQPQAQFQNSPNDFCFEDGK